MSLDPQTLRAAAYRARCALRSNMGVDGYLRRCKMTEENCGTYVRLVRMFVKVLPDLLVKHCIAEAEAQAIDIINKEWN